MHLIADDNNLRGIPLQEKRSTFAHKLSSREARASGFIDRVVEKLVEARCAARDLGLGPWEFALDLPGLRAAGVSDSELRWAVVMGYVEHRAEATLVGESTRSFRAVSNLRLTDSSCFVLTAAGEAFAKEVRLSNRPRVFLSATDEVVQCSSAAEVRHVPHWDRVRRVLRLGGMVVKEYKVPATNQEVVLAAFDELRWPLIIDDPLPPRDGLDPKRRLHDTINSLNRNQRHSLLKFRGKGGGQGICWELHHSSTRVPLDFV